MYTLNTTPYFNAQIMKVVIILHSTKLHGAELKVQPD